MHKISRCLYCGRKVRHQRGAPYCNRTCREAYYRKFKPASLRVRICEVCESQFETSVHNKKYCSPECAQIASDRQLESKKHLTYFDILSRDGFRCQYCGSTPADGVKLVVDHIYPISRGGKSEPINLITSCQRCNGCKHGKLLPKSTMADLMNRHDETEFTYEETVQAWEILHRNRSKRLK